MIGLELPSHNRLMVSHPVSEGEKAIQPVV